MHARIASPAVCSSLLAAAVAVSAFAIFAFASPILLVQAPWDSVILTTAALLWIFCALAYLCRAVVTDLRLRLDRLQDELTEQQQANTNALREELGRQFNQTSLLRMVLRDIDRRTYPRVHPATYRRRRRLT